MKAKKNTSIGYYLFWAGMVFIASIIAVLILSQIIPDSLLPSQSMTSQSTTNDQRKMIQSEMDIDDNLAIIKTEANKEKSPNAELFHFTEDNKDYMSSNTGDRVPLIIPTDTNISLYNKARIISTGQFTNYLGTTFVAGSLEFQGNFPYDFEQNSKLDALVSLELSFGWNDLPSFQEIEKFNQTSQIAIELPNLEILDLKITITDAPHASDNQRVRDIVEDYIYTLFENEIIPNNIISVSQQRLAASYISRNLSSIRLNTRNQ